MQNEIKTAQKISVECWNTFKQFMNSQHSEQDWDDYINQGNEYFSGYEENSPEQLLFVAMYFAFQNYAAKKTKEVQNEKDLCYTETSRG